MPALPINRIRNWRDCRAFIAADYHSRSGRRPVFEFLFQPVARFLVLLRLVEWFDAIQVPFILRAPLLLWLRRLSLRLGFSISLHVLGPGINLPHYGPLMIHQDACIGRNCCIHIGTVIAGSTRLRDAGDDEEFDAPIIGDNVYIAPGVKMSGPLIIADDCVIGANSVVTKSFTSPGVTIFGFPAKIVALNGSAGMINRGTDRVPALQSSHLPTDQRENSP
ncbi:MAG: serine acetyltransferase [Pseudomonadota bacterium]|nr:serine acetyltransferase [Pseudomonadota bacterium]